jgi:hypothetical protein
MNPEYAIAYIIRTSDSKIDNYKLLLMITFSYLDFYLKILKYRYELYLS